jgi:hypothetical protein
MDPGCNLELPKEELEDLENENLSENEGKLDRRRSSRLNKSGSHNNSK